MSEREIRLARTRDDALRALECLYIAVDATVANDVNAKVRAHIDALEAEITRLIVSRMAQSSFRTETARERMDDEQQ